MSNIEHKVITKKLMRKNKGVRQLYNSAFPSNERVSLDFLLWRCKKPNVNFWAFYDNNEFIGICYFITNQNKTYIFYLATTEVSRGKGYGSKILDIIKEQDANSTIFLSIEEVDEKYENYNERVSRLAFYARNGFVANDFKVIEFGITFDILSFNGTINKHDYLDIIKALCNKIMVKLYRIKFVG